MDRFSQQIIKAVRCSSIQVWYDRYMKPKERCPEMTKPNPQRGKHPLCGMMVDWKGSHSQEDLMDFSHNSTKLQNKKYPWHILTEQIDIPHGSEWRIQAIQAIQNSPVNHLVQLCDPPYRPINRGIINAWYKWASPRKARLMLRGIQSGLISP